MKENFKDIEKDKEKRIMEFIGEKKEKVRISIDERNRILDKARRVMETGKGERLTQEEKETLKEIAGVAFVAYEKAIEYLDKNELGGIKDEQEL